MPFLDLLIGATARQPHPTVCASGSAIATKDRWRDCDHLRLQLHGVERFVERLGLFAIVANAQSSGGEPESSVFEEGDDVQLTEDVRDADGNLLDVSVSWSSDNTAVAMVDETGPVIAAAGGPRRR